MTLFLEKRLPDFAKPSDFVPGLWTARVLPEGDSFSLAFAQAYEPFFIVDGKRVASDHSVAQTPHALWLYRALFGLYDCLGIHSGVTGFIAEGRYEVQSVLRLPEAELLHDSSMREFLEHSPFVQSPSIALGPCDDFETLQRHAEENFGSDATIELRLEVETKVSMRMMLSGS